jgi:hypothetical protein
MDNRTLTLLEARTTLRFQLVSGCSLSAVPPPRGRCRERLGNAKGRLTSLVRLSYLAPDIVRALLKGRKPIELTPTRLLRLSEDLPHDWSEQGQFLRFAVGRSIISGWNAR